MPGKQAIGAIEERFIVKSKANLSALLEAFFTDRLMSQRNASPDTVNSYRDCFRLLLRYAQERLKKPPSKLALEDLNAPFIGKFLKYLENERHNCAKTRNVRLAAIHSFFNYVAFEHPEHSALIQRVLAIPTKRCDRGVVDFLTPSEVDAILAAPDRKTWGGRRDHALIALAVQTGLRVRELTGLCCAHIKVGRSSYVRCHGKGRKDRCTPLTKQTAAIMRAWIHERRGEPTDPLFPNARGGRLSRDGVDYILSKHVKAAHKGCPSLRRKHVTPHCLRHTLAMDLLQAGVDATVIALWLGHETVKTVQIYVEANIKMKEEALKKTAPRKTGPSRYRPGDRLLNFLNGL